MSNITITPVDLGSVIYGDSLHEDDTLTFSGADSYVEGTLLARRKTSADSYAGVIVGTGAKTIALTALSGKSMKVGAYVLTVGNVTAGVGPATMVDPDGISASVTLATSGAHNIPSLGVTFAITAGGTELDDNATVTFTVAAGGKLVAFDPAGENGVNVPTSVLTYPVTASGSGDVPIRALVSGKVRKQRLIIDADGDGDNITAAHIEALREVGIYALSVKDLSVLDNQ